MKILLVGNGAREHVIAEALTKSPQSVELYAVMKTKNPGIAKLSENVLIAKYDNTEQIKQFALENKIDFAFIGPEDPLNNGIVDSLEEIGIKSIGPKKELAKLETSKSFARLLMQKYNIPGLPDFKAFASAEGMLDFINTLKEFVVKPDGLTGGKGVFVQGDHFSTKEEGFEYAKSVLNEHKAVVIEEKLEGQEFSLQSLCDGKHLMHFPPVQDHKRAFDEDKGPNTGGMGSYSTGKLLPFMTKQDLKEACKITKKVARAIKKETGEPYKGIMYGGFICTKNGVKLIEYNARFGDPEAMNVLPLLKNDFVEVCKATIDGSLNKIKAKFYNHPTVCKYVVPEGYPTNPFANQKVDLSKVDDKVKIYYASVDQRVDGLYMTTSRAIAFVGIDKKIDNAEKIAEHAVLSVEGPVFHRKDIGTAALIARRVNHMQMLRGS